MPLSPRECDILDELETQFDEGYWARDTPLDAGLLPTLAIWLSVVVVMLIVILSGGA